MQSLSVSCVILGVRERWRWGGRERAQWDSPSVSRTRVRGRPEQLAWEKLLLTQKPQSRALASGLTLLGFYLRLPESSWGGKSQCTVLFDNFVLKCLPSTSESPGWPACLTSPFWGSRSFLLG